MVPRSGQVPTTTWQPAATSARTASGEVAHRLRRPRARLVTSFAPIMITATSGFSARASSTCAASPGPRSPPDTASRTKRTGRSASSARADGDEDAGGLRGPLDTQADGGGVAEHGEDDRRAPARSARPAVDAVTEGGSRLVVAGLDLAAGGAGLLAQEGDQRGASRGPTPPPPYAAAVARAVVARVTVPPLRCSAAARRRRRRSRSRACSIMRYRGYRRFTVFPVADSLARVTQDTELDERAAADRRRPGRGVLRPDGGRRRRLPDQVPQDGGRSVRLLPGQRLPVLRRHGDAWRTAWCDERTSRVWIQGDLHAENFGTYMDSDRPDRVRRQRLRRGLPRARRAGTCAGSRPASRCMAWRKAFSDDVIGELLEVYLTAWLDQVEAFTRSDADRDVRAPSGRQHRGRGARPDPPPPPPAPG